MWFGNLINYAGLLAAKMTLLLQYYRVLAVPRNRFWYIIVIGLVAAVSTAQMLAFIFTCQPIEAAWNSTMEADCDISGIHNFLLRERNILTNAVIWVLPISMSAIKQLNLPRTERLLVAGIFFLGLWYVGTASTAPPARHEHCKRHDQDPG